MVDGQELAKVAVRREAAASSVVLVGMVEAAMVAPTAGDCPGQTRATRVGLELD